jgi:hypothetical protein
MSEESMPLDTRFNEVEGGQDLYPDEKGVWNLVEEGEMKVRGGRREAEEVPRWY